MDHHYYWNVFGYIVPKSEVTFFCQFIIIFILIIYSLVSITIGHNINLWSSVLCTCLGILMPNPNITISKKENHSLDSIDGQNNNRNESNTN